MKKNKNLFLVLLFSYSACSIDDTKQIGDNISGPVASSQRNNPDGFYVLNSSASAEYKDGSIQFFKKNTSTNSYELTSSNAVERLGTALSLSKDQKLVAATYSGDKKKVVVYEVDQNLSPKVTEGTEYDLTDFGNVSLLQFFTPATAASGDYYLLATTGVGTSLARVKVLKFSLASHSFENILTLPDSLPAKNLIFNFAFTTPFYHADTDLLIALPQLSRNARLPVRDDAFQIATDISKWTGTEDLRAVSLVAVNMSEFLKNRKIENAIVYHPVIYNSSVEMADASLTKDNIKNSRLDFQNQFYRSYVANQNGCFDNALIKTSDDLQKSDVLIGAIVNNGPLTDADPSEAVSGDVLRLRGLDKLKSALTTLTNAKPDSTDYKNRITTNVLSFSKFSDAEKSPVLAGIKTLVTDMKVVQIKDKCRPVWMRVESADRVVDGKERSFMEVYLGTPDHELFSFNELARASMIFSAKDNLVNTFSFSENVNNSIGLSVSNDYSNIDFTKTK